MGKNRLELEMFGKLTGDIVLTDWSIEGNTVTVTGGVEKQ